jgi:hypothetical protein
MCAGVDLIRAALEAPPEIGSIVDGIFVPTIEGLSLVKDGRVALKELLPAIDLAVRRYRSGHLRLTLRQLRRTGLKRRSARCLAAVLDVEHGIFVPAHRALWGSWPRIRRWQITDEVRHCLTVEDLSDYLQVRRTLFVSNYASSYPPPVWRTERWSSPENRWLRRVGKFAKDTFSHTLVRLTALVVAGLMVAPASTQSLRPVDGLDPVGSHCLDGSIVVDAAAVRIDGRTKSSTKVVLRRSARCGGTWAELRGNRPKQTTIALAVIRRTDAGREAESSSSHASTTPMLATTGGCIYAIATAKRKRGRENTSTRCL